MRTYEKYKESGIEWIGEIPEHWINASFRRVCERNIVGIAEAATDSYNEKGVPILRSTNIKNGVIQGEIYLIDEAFDEKNKSKRLFKNDIITVRTGYPGQSAVITEDLHNCQCFTLLISTLKYNVNPQFYNYYINSYCGIKYFEITAWGSAQLNISVPILQELPITIPTIEEQTSIANYLDSKTTEIDQVVADKEALVNLYEEEKKALINEAVTKGVALSRVETIKAKLKPSGIDWLGDVPVHWEVKKLKHVMQSMNTKRIPLSSEERGEMVERVYDYYGASGIIDQVEDFIFDEPLLLIGEDGANLLSRNSRLVFIAKGKYWVNNHAHILKTKYGLLEYYCELLEQYDFTIWVTGSAQPKLTSENLMNIEVIVPPLEEQTSIDQYIESETANINEKINQIKQEIALLKEYRQALIFEAVTGKVRVD